MNYFPRLFLRRSSFVLLAFFILATSLVLFLSTTTPGAYLSLNASRFFLPGQLRISGLEGNLARSLHIKTFSYQNDTLSISAKELDLHWHPLALLRHALLIDSLKMGELTVVTKGNEQTSPQQTRLPIDLKGKIKIAQLAIDKLSFSADGRQQQMSMLRSAFYLDNHQWQLHPSSLHYAGYDFFAKGQGATQFPYPLLTQLSIHNSAQAKIAAFTLQGDAPLLHLQGNGSAAAPFSLEGFFKNFSEIDASLSWKNFAYPINKTVIKAAPGEIRITGKFPQLLLQAQGKLLAPFPLTCKIISEKQQNLLKTSINLTSTQGKAMIDINHPLGSPLNIDATLVTVATTPALPLQKLKTTIKVRQEPNSWFIEAIGDGQYNQQPLRLNLHYKNDKLSVQAGQKDNALTVEHAAAKPWIWRATLNEPGLLYPDLTGLMGQFRIEGSLRDGQHGQLKLIAGKGSWQLPDKNRLAFAGGTLTTKLTPSTLTTKGEFTIDPEKKLTLDVTLPKFNMRQWQPQKQRVQGSVQLFINSLAFIADLHPDISQAAGNLQANINIKGKLAKPVFTGSVLLKKGSLQAKTHGLDLQPIDLALATTNNSWQLNGSIFSHDKVMQLKGQGFFYPEINGTLDVEGQDVRVIDKPEYLIYLSPNLHFSFKPGALTLRGSIVVPQAIIKPRSFNKTVTLSDDAVFTDKPINNNNPFHMDTELHVEMGDAVQLAVKGIKGLLRGAVTIRQLPEGPLNASGQLSIKDGQYKAYGQDLTIDQGQLLFNGGMLDNPDLSVRAVRKFNNASDNFSGSDQLFDFNAANMQPLDFGSKLTVGVEVTGKLGAPKINLFSNPPTLTQADILSMLLLGRPANQANKAGGQLLLAAISSMNLDSDSSGLQMLNQLKQTLGVDVNIANNSTYNKKTNSVNDSTTIVVGKSLSKRLYVSYNVGLSQADVNVLTLKYLLNKFLSIQVDTSTNGSGVDLLYTHQKD